MNSFIKSYGVPAPYLSVNKVDAHILIHMKMSEVHILHFRLLCIVLQIVRLNPSQPTWGQVITAVWTQF